MNFLLNVASLVETLVASCAMKNFIANKKQEAVRLKTFKNNKQNAASGLAKPENVSNFLTTRFSHSNLKFSFPILKLRKVILQGWAALNGVLSGS